MASLRLLAEFLSPQPLRSSTVNAVLQCPDCWGLAWRTCGQGADSMLPLLFHLALKRSSSLTQWCQFISQSAWVHLPINTERVLLGVCELEAALGEETDSQQQPGPRSGDVIDPSREANPYGESEIDWDLIRQVSKAKRAWVALHAQ